MIDVSLRLWIVDEAYAPESACHDTCTPQLQGCKVVLYCTHEAPIKVCDERCLQHWLTLGLLAGCVRLLCHDKGVDNDWQRKGLPQALEYQTGQPIRACTIAACQPDQKGQLALTVGYNGKQGFNGSPSP